ncbi:CoB-CoM heterodisulfide reductase [Deinococcus grandis]|uniref:CoB-CoM heterodisulfide reductase n=2 Tax=Deinococcus TaxID=1298 RepID=A0A117DPR4_9DEIO|nr:MULTISPECIES: (Fe-S)-binding protein [Deinococcus]BBN96854.1 Fe-S oxidoreductase [Deinococcus grandis]GAQ23862.1 CoB-CoM heterodisulfide reductase [Deinococcus grandis]SEI64920.1 L-lactate dehydrogenase complex protein LldE [Deinococcus reticulitermitis]
MHIDLFLTCVNDALFPATGQATVRLLERLGHTVGFNPAQTCCGQMHLNTGYRDDALDLVRKFVRDFKDSEVVVMPSGSCAAMVRELYAEAARWAGDDELLKDVEDLAPRVFELSEFLVNKLGVTDVGAYYPHRVTYHPTCHAMRALRVGDAPLQLLRNVRGMTLVELEGANECCGFGGTFAVKNPDVSAAMLTDKARHIIDTGAEACTAGDNSCLLHIGGGLHRLRSGARTVHLAEILASTEQEVFI